MGYDLILYNNKRIHKTHQLLKLKDKSLASSSLPKMATKWSVCSICDFQHTTKPSVVWCSECDEGLCENCRQHHSVSRSTRNHYIISIEKYRSLPNEIHEISNSCKKHHEKYHLYCQKHECPCCKICIVENHNGCNDLRDINAIVKDVKSSSALLDIKYNLEEILKDLKNIRKNRQDNLMSLTEEKNRIVEDVKEVRVAVNEYCDKIQQKIITELEAIEEAESKKICQILNTVNTKEQETEKNIRSLENIKLYASDLQTFLFMKQIENDVKGREESIQSISQSKNLIKTTISCKFNLTAQEFSRTFPKFGEIIIQAEPSKIHLGNSKRKSNQAQTFASLPILKSFESLKLTLLKEVKTNGENVTGCSYLPGGNMVFSHNSKDKLQILKVDGSKDFEIKPDYEIFDVVYNYKDNILVASTDVNKCFLFIDIQRKEIKKSFKLEARCNGVDIAEESLIYCAGEKGIQRINFSDKSVATIISKNQERKSYVAFFDNKMYYTNISSHKLKCCNLEGRTQWKYNYRDILRFSRGISVDNDGNVYVVGQRSNNVVVISPDGQRHREVLSNKDGLDQPRAIHYDKTSNRLLVANKSGTAFMFNVTK
ncbi:unnamed protein product [Mytilus coruscus]|uniref:B box-type domain-containing protein n=1 Tax=Mytilus coruscus TaxID=42192 RepID=A0A6J8BML1_MYTCO|nr:unnamed protein product [Mytilus coruscus]